MVNIIYPISHKLSGQYMRFTAWFGTILIYSFVWNGLDLQLGLE